MKYTRVSLWNWGNGNSFKFCESWDPVNLSSQLRLTVFLGNLKEIPFMCSWVIYMVFSEMPQLCYELLDVDGNAFFVPFGVPSLMESQLIHYRTMSKS